jgi:APA family basic amino acid/polyamine antiporter
MAAADSARVGAFTAGCVLVSNSVGSGIFTTTGFMARDLGDPWLVLGLWLLGGLFALAGAMSYAELAAALPRSGGEYVYLTRAFGPLAGFLSGWTSFTSGFGAAIAAAAAAFGELLAGSGAPGGIARDPRVAGLALVWGLTAVHALGVGPAGAFQRALTIAKVGGVALLVALGVTFGSGDWSHLGERAQAAPGVGTACAAFVFVLWTFSGWNAAAYLAGEVRDPARAVPRALVGGTLVVCALYLALNLVYFYALPASELAREPVLPVAGRAASALLGPDAGRAVDAALGLSLAGAVSSMTWVGPRVYQAMAQDGALPRALGATTRTGAPRRALLLQSALASVLLWSGTFEQLVLFGGVALASFGALAVLAVIALRAREPELARPYRVAGYPWLPLGYAAASLVVVGWAAIERPAESALALASVAAGVPLYHVWRST